jgi:hypothetical protein
MCHSLHSCGVPISSSWVCQGCFVDPGRHDLQLAVPPASAHLTTAVLRDAIARTSTHQALMRARSVVCVRQAALRRGAGVVEQPKRWLAGPARQRKAGRRGAVRACLNVHCLRRGHQLISSGRSRAISTRALPVRGHKPRTMKLSLGSQSRSGFSAPRRLRVSTRLLFATPISRVKSRANAKQEVRTAALQSTPQDSAAPLTDAEAEQVASAADEKGATYLLTSYAHVACAVAAAAARPLCTKAHAYLSLHSVQLPHLALTSTLPVNERTHFTQAPAQIRIHLTLSKSPRLPALRRKGKPIRTTAAANLLRTRRCQSSLASILQRSASCTLQEANMRTRRNQNTAQAAQRLARVVAR